MDRKTFIEKVLPHQNAIFRFANRMLSNKEDAEDLMQEVFIKLWVRKKLLQKTENVGAFAMTATKNLCIDMLRKRKKSPAYTDNENIISNLPTPACRFELDETSKQIGRIIENLPEKQKMIIHLRDIEGLSYQEIEKITGMKINAIKVNLSRARRKVRDILIERYDYEHNYYEHK